MHELSLVRSLLRQVHTVVADAGGGEATEVRVSIGPLSGVEPMLVQSAFERCAAESGLDGAELKIDHSRLEACCKQCRQPFVVESFSFQCPTCRSRSVQVTSGDQFRLISVSVSQPNPDPPE